MVQVFQLGRHDAHHTFMKLWVKHAQGGWRQFIWIEHVLRNGQGLVTHVALDHATFSIDAV